MQNPREKYGQYMTAGNTVKPYFLIFERNLYVP